MANIILTEKIYASANMKTTVTNLAAYMLHQYLRTDRKELRVHQIGNRVYYDDGQVEEKMLAHSMTFSVPREKFAFPADRKMMVYDEVDKLPDEKPFFTIQIVGVGQSKPNVFRIQITADSEESCEAYMEAAKRAIESYGAQLQEQIGSHGLTLLSESQTERIDRGIQSYQNEVLNSYTTTFTQLKNMQTELETVVEEEGETIVVGEAVSYASPVREGVKFAVIGVVLGAFLAAFILVVIYLMSGKLQSTESFREEFGMPLLGQITKSPAKKRIFGFLDRWLQRIEEGEYADITYEEQLKIAAANLKTAISKDGGMKRIMLAGTIAKDEAEAFRTRLVPELEGITVSAYERIVFQASALEELDRYDGVLFLEKRGVSYTKLIKKEKSLVADRNVAVLGAVVL